MSGTRLLFRILSNVGLRLVHLLMAEGKEVWEQPCQPSYPDFDALRLSVLEPQGQNRASTEALDPHNHRAEIKGLLAGRDDHLTHQSAQIAPGIGDRVEAGLRAGWIAVIRKLAHQGPTVQLGTGPYLDVSRRRGLNLPFHKMGQQRPEGAAE